MILSSQKPLADCKVYLVVSLPGQAYCFSKFRQTGSGHAADVKLLNTIHFSILMLFAKYQKAYLCGSSEKCDGNYFVINFPNKKNYKCTWVKLETVIHDTVLHTDALC